MASVHEQKRRFQQATGQDQVIAPSALYLIQQDYMLHYTTSTSLLNFWLAICNLGQDVIQKLRLVIVTRPIWTPAISASRSVHLPISLSSLLKRKRIKVLPVNVIRVGALYNILNVQA